MHCSIRNVLLGALLLVARTCANPDADDVQDGSVDSIAAAAMYTGDLLESNAMGMSKRSLDLFPRSDCGHERFYCSRRFSKFCVAVESFVRLLAQSKLTISFIAQPKTSFQAQSVEGRLLDSWLIVCFRCKRMLPTRLRLL